MPKNPLDIFLSKCKKEKTEMVLIKIKREKMYSSNRRKSTDFSMSSNFNGGLDWGIKITEATV